MYEVIKKIEFCYGHRLLRYDGACRFLHGHNAVAEFVVGGEKLDTRGMLTDFSDIKRIMQAWIDGNLDHRMLLNREDPMATLLAERGEPVYQMDENPTAENIARLLFTQARSRGLQVTEVRLWETPHACAVWKEAAR